VELQARYGEFQKLGLEIASLTYDAPATIKRFADERKIEFPILSDEDHSIVEIVVNNETRQLAQKPGSSMMLKGMLEYQACRKTTCDPPQQLPLSWTVELKPLG
jgi:peroxiredoxin